jgi:hypothetical protein
MVNLDLARGHMSSLMPISIGETTAIAVGSQRGQTRRPRARKRPDRSSPPPVIKRHAGPRILEGSRASGSRHLWRWKRGAIVRCVATPRNSGSVAMAATASGGAVAAGGVTRTLPPPPLPQPRHHNSVLGDDRHGQRSHTHTHGLLYRYRDASAASVASCAAIPFGLPCLSNVHVCFSGCASTSALSHRYDGRPRNKRINCGR